MFSTGRVALIIPSHLGSSHQLMQKQTPVFMRVKVVLVSVTIAPCRWLMNPGLVGDTWASPNFDWYGVHWSCPVVQQWPRFTVRRFFLFLISHRICPEYISGLDDHLVMRLSSLPALLGLWGHFLDFCSLELLKVTSLSITHAETLGTPFSHGYVHSEVVCAREEASWYLGSRV